MLSHSATQREQTKFSLYEMGARPDQFNDSATLLGAFQVSGADFAYLTTESDQKKKNFRVMQEPWGRVEGFVGDDPEKGIPGLYWMNVFGSPYVEWFGLERIEKTPATDRKVLSDGALFLQYGGEAADVESKGVTDLQTVAKRILGEDAFFDISLSERPLRVPPF